MADLDDVKLEEGAPAKKKNPKGDVDPRPKRLSGDARSSEQTKQFVFPTEKGLDHAVCDQQGDPSYHEDRHVIHYNPVPDVDAFFGVFDGHGGDRAARYCMQYCHTICFADPELVKNDLEAALRQGYDKLEKEILDDSRKSEDKSGTTGCTVTLQNNKLYCANTGDSRAVLAKTNHKGDVVAVELSKDHKPDDETEKARILAHGGTVEEIIKKGTTCFCFESITERTFRCNPGGLAVSRTLGDITVKDPDVKKSKIKVPGAVIATCDVSITPVDKTCRYVIVASDGVWDIMNSQEAVDYVEQKIIQEDLDPSEAAASLCNLALQSGSTDNVTAMVIYFTQW